MSYFKVYAEIEQCFYSWGYCHSCGQTLFWTPNQIRYVSVNQLLTASINFPRSSRSLKIVIDRFKRSYLISLTYVFSSFNSSYSTLPYWLKKNKKVVLKSVIIILDGLYLRFSRKIICIVSTKSFRKLFWWQPPPENSLFHYCARLSFVLPCVGAI